MSYFYGAGLEDGSMLGLGVGYDLGYRGGARDQWLVDKAYQAHCDPYFGGAQTYGYGLGNGYRTGYPGLSGNVVPHLGSFQEPGSAYSSGDNRPYAVTGYDSNGQAQATQCDFGCRRIKREGDTGWDWTEDKQKAVCDWKKCRKNAKEMHRLRGEEEDSAEDEPVHSDRADSEVAELRRQNKMLKARLQQTGSSSPRVTTLNDVKKRDNRKGNVTQTTGSRGIKMPSL